MFAAELLQVVRPVCTWFCAGMTLAPKR